MAYLNEMRIIGNVAKEPTFKVLESGNVLVRFNVGISRNRKRADGSDNPLRQFYWVKLIGSKAMADFLSDRMGVGAMVLVTGEHTVDEYEDDNGRPCTFEYIMATDLQVLRSPKKAVAAVDQSEDESTTISAPEEKSIDAPVAKELPKPARNEKPPVQQASRPPQAARQAIPPRNTSRSQHDAQQHRQRQETRPCDNPRNLLDF